MFEETLPFYNACFFFVYLQFQKARNFWSDAPSDETKAKSSVPRSNLSKSLSKSTPNLFNQTFNLRSKFEAKEEEAKDKDSRFPVELKSTKKNKLDIDLKGRSKDSDSITTERKFGTNKQGINASDPDKLKKFNVELKSTRKQTEAFVAKRNIPITETRRSRKEITGTSEKQPDLKEKSAETSQDFRRRRREREGSPGKSDKKVEIQQTKVIERHETPLEKFQTEIPSVNENTQKPAVIRNEIHIQLQGVKKEASDFIVLDDRTKLEIIHDNTITVEERPRRQIQRDLKDTASVHERQLLQNRRDNNDTVLGSERPRIRVNKDIKLAEARSRFGQTKAEKDIVVGEERKRIKLRKDVHDTVLGNERPRTDVRKVTKDTVVGDEKSQIHITKESDTVHVQERYRIRIKKDSVPSGNLKDTIHVGEKNKYHQDTIVADEKPKIQITKSVEDTIAGSETPRRRAKKDTSDTEVVIVKSQSEKATKDIADIKERFKGHLNKERDEIALADQRPRIRTNRDILMKDEDPRVNKQTKETVVLDKKPEPKWKKDSGETVLGTQRLRIRANKDKVETYLVDTKPRVEKVIVDEKPEVRLKKETKFGDEIPKLKNPKELNKIDKPVKNETETKGLSIPDGRPIIETKKEGNTFYPDERPRIQIKRLIRQRVEHIYDDPVVVPKYRRGLKELRRGYHFGSELNEPKPKQSVAENSDESDSDLKEKEKKYSKEYSDEDLKPKQSEIVSAHSKHTTVNNSEDSEPKELNPKQSKNVPRYSKHTAEHSKDSESKDLNPKQSTTVPGDSKHTEVDESEVSESKDLTYKEDKNYSEYSTKKEEETTRDPNTRKCETYSSKNSSELRKSKSQLALNITDKDLEIQNLSKKPEWKTKRDIGLKSRNFSELSSRWKSEENLLKNKDKFPFELTKTGRLNDLGSTRPLGKFSSPKKDVNNTEIGRKSVFSVELKSTGSGLKSTGKDLIKTTSEFPQKSNRFPVELKSKREGTEIDSGKNLKSTKQELSVDDPRGKTVHSPSTKTEDKTTSKFGKFSVELKSVEKAKEVTSDQKVSLDSKKSPKDITEDTKSPKPERQRFTSGLRSRINDRSEPESKVIVKESEREKEKELESDEDIILTEDSGKDQTPTEGSLGGSQTPTEGSTGRSGSQSIDDDHPESDVKSSGHGTSVTETDSDNSSDEDNFGSLRSKGERIQYVVINSFCTSIQKEVYIERSEYMFLENCFQK